MKRGIPPLAALLFAIPVWVGLYAVIQPLAEWISFSLLGFSRGSGWGESIAFFLYDVPKILLLLTAMVFAISFLRTYFSPERARALLGGKREGIGNVLAAALGVITPFCSCSAVPLFIGFVESGIPLGVTLTFLIAAPTINEVAVVLLYGMFGWKVALVYVAAGLAIAIAAGIILGRLRLERFVEEFVWQVAPAAGSWEDKPSFADRLRRAYHTTADILGKVWPFVIVGIGVGAGIHGFVPNDILSGILAGNAWWSIPAAVLLGIPLYSNAAGIIPVVAALIEKGVPLGTALAFMMSVVGISLPELIILRRVLKPPLLLAFTGIVAVAIIFIGYLFNILVI